MSSYYGAGYDHYSQKIDDSKALKLKSAYWTTKQAMISKLRRKQDENIVASDADLDSKLELLKSIQNTCRDLSVLLLRYQRTICYLSQAENEMGRFLKQYSLEDKTQAGKIMSAVGKALSQSAQNRLTLRNPLDRVSQELKTFRQRAIIDTVSTLKRMETCRTEYRGALLWMKNVSEELDPDTYNQLEKFRCVQAQVRKSKSSFDRLKIDSMQKIDLLAASRCNMLSHVLVGYQNTLLTFLEKTSKIMVSVAESFKGYQYYEFSVLKHLRQESRKLAGHRDSESGTETSSDNDQDSNSSADGVGYSYLSSSKSGYEPVQMVDSCESLQHKFTKHHVWNDEQSSDAKSKSATSSAQQDQNKPHSFNLVPTEEELDKRLDDIFRSDDAMLNLDDLRDFGMPDSNRSDTASMDNHAGDLLASSNSDVPLEHRDLFADLFATDSSPDSILPTGKQLQLDSPNQLGSKSTFAAEWNSVFGNTTDVDQSDDFGPMQGVHQGETDLHDFRNVKSSILPSQLLDRDLFNLSLNSGGGGGDSVGSTTTRYPVRPLSQNLIPNLNKSEQPGSAQPTVPGHHKSVPNSEQETSKRISQQQPTNLDAWMSLFSDLGPLGNPDHISKKDGQITDA